MQEQVLRGACIPLLTPVQVFLNVVLDDAVEEKDGGEKIRLGMVVCPLCLPSPPYL